MGIHGLGFRDIRNLEIHGKLSKYPHDTHLPFATADFIAKKKNHRLSSLHMRNLHVLVCAQVRLIAPCVAACPVAVVDVARIPHGCIQKHGFRRIRFVLLACVFPDLRAIDKPQYPVGAPINCVFVEI